MSETQQFEGESKPPVADRVRAVTATLRENVNIDAKAMLAGAGFGAGMDTLGTLSSGQGSVAEALVYGTLGGAAIGKGLAMLFHFENDESLVGTLRRAWKTGTPQNRATNINISSY